MTTFPEWLTSVLTDGVSEQADPPALLPSDRPAVESILRSSYRIRSLDVGGPPLPIDLDVALGAAVTLAGACWQLVADQPDAPPLKSRLKPPHSASAHLSADLTLRLLPAVHRRAKSRNPDDPLVAFCENLFRRCPLSGVLAGIPGGPEAPESLDFFGHVGLQVLYAERLVERPQSAWVPPGGPAREQVERVFARHRKPVPHPAVALESAP